MCRAIVVLTAIVVFSVLSFLGCGNDDDVITSSCPRPVVYADGHTFVDSCLLLNLELYPYGGADPGIDSVTIDGMPANVHRPVGLYGSGANWHTYIATLQKCAESPEYASGDTVETIVYAGDRTGSCRVRLLDYTADAVGIVPPTDTVVFDDDTVEIVWEKIVNADWYCIGITVEWNYSIIGNYVYYTFDTTFTVPDSVLIPSIWDDYTWVWVMPVTGPDPRSPDGNWTGDLVAGRLFSYADWGEVFFRVWSMGAAERPSASSRARPRPEPSPGEIIRAVYDRYR